MKRSELFRSIADDLLAGCSCTIDASGASLLDESFGDILPGTVIYVAGELVRVRGADLRNVGGMDLVTVGREYLRRWDSTHEINVCFALMGMGLMGAAGSDHPILGGLDEQTRSDLREKLRITESFENNWEAFNGCIAGGRHRLWSEPAEAMLPHLEKIAAKYDRTGYFDDTDGLGNYNSYGLMSLNYSLRAAELLDEADSVRVRLAERFRPHVERYVRLIRDLMAPDGTGWTFGRSAGVMGQLQCIVLLEQTLSWGWLDEEQARWARAASRAAAERMCALFWDKRRQWFSFHSDEHTAYEYRRSLPMAWDLLRYFLQLEHYARTDESRGDAAEAETIHPGRVSKEIVTDPQKKTAVYVWSDGTDHAVLPIMAGPEAITGDTLPRPYARGLFEWVTQKPIPVLVPRLTIRLYETQTVEAWPAWRATRTALACEGERDVYRAEFDVLYSPAGKPVAVPLKVHVDYVFAAGLFERRDTLLVEAPLALEGFEMQVLQAAAHIAHAAGYGPVRQLRVSLDSQIEGITLSQRLDIAGDPTYRNYYGHPSGMWRIGGENLSLQPGEYRIVTRLQW